MRIVVDAFGSDSRPGPDVEGAVWAAQKWGDEIILVGPEDQVTRELVKHRASGQHLRIVHAPEVLTMEDHAEAVRHKSQSSIRVGMQLVKNGEADAFVSAGNTIAVLSSAIFDLRRITGIRRPALATLYPVADRRVLLLDVGATADPKPEYLLQFAEMGVIYAERVWGITNPRVGLLANGEEDEKGTLVLRDTHAMFRASRLNFVGNVEPKEVTRGLADVVVTDGFTGNIMIKTAESVASFAARVLKRDLLEGLRPKLGLALMAPGLLLQLPGLMVLRPVFGKIARRMDYAEHGGGLLLGVDGVVVVAHGRSNSKAIMNAIRQCREAVSAKVVPAIKDGLLMSSVDSENQA